MKQVNRSFTIFGFLVGWSYMKIMNTMTLDDKNNIKPELFTEQYLN